ncbi:hypothetical protein P9043_21530 [Bacillus cereus]|nr:hypothetical protein [Bacillus cereus]
MKRFWEKVKEYRYILTIVAEFCSVGGFVLSVIALVLTVGMMA